MARFIRGITFKPGDVVASGTDGAVAVMRTKNVQAELDVRDVLRVPETFVRRSEQYLRSGDILVSSANSWNLVGKGCWVPELQEPAVIGGFVTALRATDSRLDSRYLYYWFTSRRTQETVRSFGNKTTSISNLNIGRCQDLTLPLPPLTEQRRIAAILDHADALRVKRRKTLALLDDLARSVFVEMFEGRDWPRRTLVDLCASPDDIKCGPFGTQLQKSEFREVGVPLWGIKNVNAKFQLPAWEFLDHGTARRLAQYSLMPDDIVMTRKGTIGNCAVYPAGFPLGIMHSDLLRLRVDERRVLPPFLSHQLQESPLVARQLHAVSGGAVMPGINVTKLKQLAVEVPPLDLQREFVERTESIDVLRAMLTRHAESLSTMFAALQAHAFSGAPDVGAIGARPVQG